MHRYAFFLAFQDDSGQGYTPVATTAAAALAAAAALGNAFPHTLDRLLVGVSLE